MTQILAAAFENYVVLVSDRRLTVAEGPRRGRVVTDDECKLVNLCNICGIGYTGLSVLGSERQRTDEWIATTLADRNCIEPASAARALQECAPAGVSIVAKNLRRQAFLLAGWSGFVDVDRPRPFIARVSNFHADQDRTLPTAFDDFKVHIKRLDIGQPMIWAEVGSPLSLGQSKNFHRSLRSAAERGLPPRDAIRLLVEQVKMTHGRNRNVGERLLAMCIPRRPAEEHYAGSGSIFVASRPLEDVATFMYLDPVHDEVQQHGPTIACGGTAMTDLETESDPANDYQSSSVRILRLPQME